MVSKTGAALRAFTTFVRALQFLIAALVLGIFSYFLACMSNKLVVLWAFILILHRPLDPSHVYPNMGEGR